MTGPEPPSGDIGDVADRLVEVSDRLDRATSDLRRLVERMRTALEGSKHAHARRPS